MLLPAAKEEGSGEAGVDIEAVSAPNYLVTEESSPTPLLSQSRHPGR